MQSAYALTLVSMISLFTSINVDDTIADRTGAVFAFVNFIKVLSYEANVTLAPRETRPVAYEMCQRACGAGLIDSSAAVTVS